MDSDISAAISTLRAFARQDVVAVFNPADRDAAGARAIIAELEELGITIAESDAVAPGDMEIVSAATLEEMMMPRISVFDIDEEAMADAELAEGHEPTDPDDPPTTETQRRPHPPM
jgi:hypothetical protein